MNNPARCLVTGGLGFIGSHVVELLVEAGHRVVVIDNEATGKAANLESVSERPNLSVINADVADLEAIRPHFAGVDRVFHIAALASIVPSIEHPVDYFTTNVTGTMNVVEASRLAGVKRLVYAASSSCYGLADEIPTTETAAISPQYPYALTKYLGEQLVMHWGQVYGLGVASLRLFNVYGPRARVDGAYGAVLGVFLAQKLADAPMTIVGDGEQSRDFTYVTDVAEAFVAAGNSSSNGEIFNIGSGGTYTVNHLAGLIGGETVNLPKRPGEPDSTYADTSKVKEILGWSPKYTFEEGIASTMKQIDYWREAPVWTPDLIADQTASWFAYLGESDSE